MKITVTVSGGITLTAKEKQDIETQVRNATGTYLIFDGGTEPNIEVAVVSKDQDGKYIAKVKSVLPIIGKI